MLFARCRQYRSHNRPDATRTCIRRSPRHARSFTRRTARLPAEVLKLLAFSFLQSISNFVVSLPNLSEKDVKGLLFRKQPRTGAGFRLFEIGEAIQTLLSAYRT